MKEILEACKEGNNEIVKNFFASDSRANSEVFTYNQNMAIEAISSGRIDTLEIILNSSPKDKFFFSDVNINAFTKKSCDDNNLEMLHYLLNYPAIIEYKYNELAWKICSYCISKGKLEIFDYIIENFPTDYELYKRLKEGEATSLAAKYGHTHILEYIFNNEKLKQYNDIHIFNDKAFKGAVAWKKIDILEYFIFDKNIDITPEIQKIIETDRVVASMFESRDLKQSLIQHLDNTQNNNIIKRTKI
jgi:hypothetical protein